MKTLLLKHALLLPLILCVCGTLSGQGEQSAANVVEVRLVDASTTQIIPNASVEVRSQNGNICKKAPCPQNSLSWKGVSGADGVLRIPSHIIQHLTTVKVAGYLAINFKEARATDGKSVVELQLDTWHVRFMVRREGGSSVWLISRGDIAAGDETNRSDLWQAFPCRTRLSAENLRRMETVLSTVKPSAWDYVYGSRRSDAIYSRDLLLERAGADGDVNHSTFYYRGAEEEMPQDLQALLATMQAVIKQSFAKQSCSLDAKALKYQMP